MRRVGQTIAAIATAVVLVLVGAFSVGVGAAAAQPARATATTYPGTRGQITPVTQVIPGQLATAKSTAKAATNQPRTAPTRARPISNKGVASAGSRPGVASTGVQKSGQLLRSFNGIDEIQNLAASATPLEPPDEGLGVGNGYVFNLVNVTGAIYRPNGALVVGPFSANAFFAEPADAFTSDPRVYFDKASNTWFAAILEVNFDTGNESHLDLAVNASGNPTTAWTIYRIDTTNPTEFECPCLPDYPMLGIDQYNVYLSDNEFSITGSAFNGTEMYAISKSQLRASATANFVRFGPLSIAGAPAYHVQPAVSYGNPNAEYFLNSLDPNSTFDTRLGAWAMTHRASVTSGNGMPILSSVVINSEAYGFPVPAQTPPGFNSFLNMPTTGMVDPDFDAMQEVEYINGHLVGALDTSVTIEGDTGTRDGIAWFQVEPKLSGDVISGKTKVSRQGYIASRGLFLLYPHINETKNGRMVITFSLGGPGTFLSAAYAVKSATGRNFGTIKLAGAGVAPDNGFTATAQFGGLGRWGDYSAGQLDESGNRVWLATQYIPNNGDQFANWGNRIFEVQP